MGDGCCSLAGPGLSAMDAPTGDWWVLHTRPRQEKAVARDLEALNIVHYLPLVNTIRYYGRRKMQVELPLFAGYVFLRGSVEQAWAVERSGRLAQIIAVHDQDRLEVELNNLRLVLDSGQELDPHPYLREGMWVEVRSGPLKGVQGIIERKRHHSRLVLQIEALGQATSLEIDGSLLEPIERAMCV